MMAEFNPVVDGFSFASGSDPGITWSDEWQGAFAAAVPQALSDLRPSFGQALELHDVPGWLARPALAHAMVGAGWVFAAMDHFLWPANPGSEKPALKEYLRRRHLDFWRDNGPVLLKWLAVRYKLPEEWLPRLLMERQLQTRLSHLSFVTSVEVHIELTLGLAGGTPWLRERSRDQWLAVQRSLSSDGLCPIAIFSDAGAQVLLAFGWRDGMQCYDPAHPGEVRTITQESVDGLLRLRYSRVAPPLNSWQRLASTMGLARAHWRLVRAWRTFASASI